MQKVIFYMTLFMKSHYLYTKGGRLLDIMSSKEAADYIGVSINTLRKYVHEEGLPVLRFPGRRKWVFRKDLIDEWVYRRSQPEILITSEESKSTKIRVLKP